MMKTQKLASYNSSRALAIELLEYRLLKIVGFKT